MQNLEGWKLFLANLSLNLRICKLDTSTIVLCVNYEVNRCFGLKCWLFMSPVGVMMCTVSGKRTCWMNHQYLSTYKMDDVEDSKYQECWWPGGKVTWDLGGRSGRREHTGKEEHRCLRYDMRDHTPDLLLSTPSTREISSDTSLPDKCDVILVTSPTLLSDVMLVCVLCGVSLVPTPDYLHHHHCNCQ